MKRSDALAMCRKIMGAASRAADASGAHRDFAELEVTILRQERQHRALGRRLVGVEATKGRFTIAQAVEYFVARTLADAAKHDSEARPISSLVGTREDYVRAAILFARQEFREKFWIELSRVFPKPIPSLPDSQHGPLVLKQIDGVDYCDLVGSR